MKQVTTDFSQGLDKVQSEQITDLADPMLFFVRTVPSLQGDSW